MPFTADTLGSSRVSEPWSTVLFAANVALVAAALAFTHPYLSIGLLLAESVVVAWGALRRTRSASRSAGAWGACGLGPQQHPGSSGRPVRPNQRTRGESLGVRH